MYVRDYCKELHKKMSRPKSDLPKYTDLPPVPGMPPGCAWGIWDTDGVKDQIGSLNLLTPENTLQAKKEIQTGVSVSLKLVPTQPKQGES